MTAQKDGNLLEVEEGDTLLSQKPLPVLPSDTLTQVGGRLKQFSSAWQEIHASPWVTRTVKEGLKLEFVSPPPGHFCINQRQQPDKQASLESEIATLILKGVLIPVPEEQHGKGFYSPIFLIKKPNGSFRLIINLKSLNKSIIYKKFKMETIKSTTQILPQDCFMATVDLQDAYYHVPIYHRHQCFLRIAIYYQGRLSHFQFTALSFGLSSAPRVFSKIMSDVMKFLHLQGVQIVPYLDDFLVFAESRQLLHSCLKQIQDCLTTLGWIINPKKSDLIPSQEKVFLGVLLDSRRLMSFLPQDKQSHLIQTVSLFSSKDRSSIRDIMAVLGLLTAAIPSVRWAQSHTSPSGLSPIFMGRKELISRQKGSRSQTGKTVTNLVENKREPERRGSLVPKRCHGHYNRRQQLRMGRSFFRSGSSGILGKKHAGRLLKFKRAVSCPQSSPFPLQSSLSKTRKIFYRQHYSCGVCKQARGNQNSLTGGSIKRHFLLGRKEPSVPFGGTYQGGKKCGGRLSQSPSHKGGRMVLKSPRL
ncbi:uncharacterized protein LOC122940815 [Bufo gargarizans]|uniref:uncharacterized protein LOC122940815 n=1 Tax=Bufo gargarizans TaxID=30331 RepID=UPI001CF5B4D8|nr:uncharacterized protein LOC122940815 [Bufo gargarizans]